MDEINSHAEVKLNIFIVYKIYFMNNLICLYHSLQVVAISNSIGYVKQN